MNHKSVLSISPLGKAIENHSDQESTLEKQEELTREREESLEEYMKLAQELWNDSCTAPRKK